MSKALLLLRQPTEDLVVVDHSSNALHYRKTITRTVGVNLNDIHGFRVEKRIEFTSIFETPFIRKDCLVLLQLRDNAEHALFHINTKRIFKSSNVDIEAEIYEVAKEICEELNGLIRK